MYLITGTKMTGPSCWTGFLWMTHKQLLITVRNKNKDISLHYSENQSKVIKLLLIRYPMEKLVDLYILCVHPFHSRNIFTWRKRNLTLSSTHCKRKIPSAINSADGGEGVSESKSMVQFVNFVFAVKQTHARGTSVSLTPSVHEV